MRISYIKIAMGVALVACLLLCTMLGGCAPKTAGTYKLYTYDTNQNKFVYLETELEIAKDMTSYEFTYYDTIHLMGIMQKVGAGYLLECDGNVHAQIAQAVVDLTEDKPIMTEETESAWKQGFVTQEQMFVYGDYMFSSASVDLMRRITAGDKRISYTAVDGYYESVSNTDSVYLFKNGYVYATEVDDKGNYQKDKDGEPVLSTTPNASYTVDNGFLVLTRLTEKGTPLKTDGKVVRAAYLLATITYPADIGEIAATDDQYSENVKELAQLVKGKSVGVLTKTFYTTKDISDNDFN